MEVCAINESINIKQESVQNGKNESRKPIQIIGIVSKKESFLHSRIMINRFIGA